MLRLQMREWERITYAENAALAGLSLGDELQATALAAKLAKAGMLEVMELRHGLSVRSTSYVGHVQLGNLQITVQPKIELNVLRTLFAYTYHLRDLHLVANNDLGTESAAFQDILIHQFLAEVTKLVTRGLHRQYRKAEGTLAASKGRIDLQKVSKRAGMNSVDLPVIHHPRVEDHLLNQVLYSGVILATSLTTDRVLQSRLRRLANLMEGRISPVHLDFGIMMGLRHGMTRLTAHYEAAITLIELLMSSTGISLETSIQRAALPGFLFDMNTFFERLLSRFLKENLANYTVHDQHRIKGMMTYSPEHNPKGRRSPTPRPDFVVTEGDRLVGILDAKYRDLWNQSLPREMLYQVAIYALSQGWNGRSIILYPAISNRPVPQIIEINQPFVNVNKARIVLTPVDLNRLSQLLQDTSVSGRANRAAYAENLVLGTFA